MSALSAKLQRWRDLGLPSYLAYHLGISVKQVTRYWDRGWIPNRRRTRRGARRIRYDDTTVEKTRTTVKNAKETGANIRYRLSQVNFKAIAFEARACNSMSDLYRLARRAGLQKRDARLVAYRPRLNDPEPSASDLAWQLLLALQNTSQEEIFEPAAALDFVPAASVMNAGTPEAFQGFAARALRDAQSCGSALENGGATPAVKELLNQPDRYAFARCWNKITELESRVLETKAAVYEAIHKKAAVDPNGVRLLVAVFAVKRDGQKPTARALSGALGLSRPALYRRFGKRAIQDALRLIRNDALSIHSTREKE